MCPIIGTQDQHTKFLPLNLISPITKTSLDKEQAKPRDPSQQLQVDGNVQNFFAQQLSTSSAPEPTHLLYSISDPVIQKDPMQILLEVAEDIFSQAPPAVEHPSKRHKLAG